MDRWDVIIMLVAVYMAVMSLVRLMARRRNQVVDHVREKIAEHRGKGPAAKPADEPTDREAA